MRRLLLVVLAGLLLSAAPATANTRTDIFRDCQDDGQLSGDYAPADLRDAQKNLPDDLREYSDCEDVLRRAALSGTGKKDDGGGDTGGTTTGGDTGTPSGGAPAPEGPPTAETPEDQAALDSSKDAGQQPLSVGDGDDKRTIVPAAAGGDGVGANDLPAALVVALILLGLAGIALSIPPVRRRFSS